MTSPPFDLPLLPEVVLGVLGDFVAGSFRFTREVGLLVSLLSFSFVSDVEFKDVIDAVRSKDSTE